MRRGESNTRLSSAIDELAAVVPNGALLAATDPAQLLTISARRLAALERVVEKAEEWREAKRKLEATGAVSVGAFVQRADELILAEIDLDTALAALDEGGDDASGEGEAATPFPLGVECAVCHAEPGNPCTPGRFVGGRRSPHPRRIMDAQRADAPTPPARQEDGE